MVPAYIAVWLLSTYAHLSTTFNWLLNILNVGAMAVINAFEPQIYLYFDTYTPSVPYRNIHVNESASTSAEVEWTYNADTREFFEGVGTNHSLHRRSYPYLSIELVKSSGRVAYDLTDFLEEIRIYSDKRNIPSIAHVIAAWSIGSQIIPSPDVIDKVRIIDDSGKNHELSYENVANGGAPIDIESDATEETVAEGTVAEEATVEPPAEVTASST